MKPLNIVVDRNMRGVEHYFQGLGTVQRVDGRGLSPDQLKHTDVLLVRSVTRVDEALLSGTAVKFVGTATSGVDHVDRDFLSQQSIGFSHAPGSNANSVVEYVLSAVASIGDKLEGLLAGQTLGIIGFGHVGRALAQRALAMGIQYRVYDPWLDATRIHNSASLADILACKVVSIHAELTREAPWPSYHLLGATQLAAMTPDTLLINAARGDVVDNAALLSLRECGRGPLSVLDVWQGEPEISAQLLDKVELGTAHIAGYSDDGKLLATRMLRDAVSRHYGVESKVDDIVEPPPVLQVPAGLSGADLLRWALAARYDIREDDRLLRVATDGLNGAESALAFDQLRKNYRQRRELFGSSAVIAPGNSQAPLLKALGVIVNGASGELQ